MGGVVVVIAISSARACEDRGRLDDRLASGSPPTAEGPYGAWGCTAAGRIAAGPPRDRQARPLDPANGLIGV